MPAVSGVRLQPSVANHPGSARRYHSTSAGRIPPSIDMLESPHSKRSAWRRA